MKVFKVFEVAGLLRVEGLLMWNIRLDSGLGQKVLIAVFI
jgi:hypothetical protein